MGIKKFNPITNGLREKTVITNDELSPNGALKALTFGKKRGSGRMATGSISVRRRGGGHKKKFRIIDFKRNKFDIPARVASLEYDPNRTAYIALLFYKDGEKRYIVAPDGLKVNDVVVSGEACPIKTGNAMRLKNIPVGTIVHNVEMEKDGGAKIGRAAGCSVQITGFEGKYCALKLSSGELRMINAECLATIGQVSNIDHMNEVLGKAGRARWKGIRPSVRGMVMNPVDHPHGGGEGKNKGRNPCTPWGQPTKGYKTRSKKKPSSKFIIRRRKK